MPVPTHMKFVFRGIFNGTPEEWSFSLKCSRDNVASTDAGYGDIVQQGVTDALVALIATSNFQSSVWCTGWRAYVIGTDGLTEGNPLIVEFPVSSEIKGLSSTRFPTDISLCVTTEAENRGPARFGRFYFPGPATALQPDHRLSISSANTWLTAVTNFTKSISDRKSVV